MNDHTETVSLAQYKSWADNIFYDAVSQIDEAELTVQRPMLFGSILALLNHVYAMDRVWSCNLQGTAHHLLTRNPETVPSFATLREQQTDINLWFEQYTKSLSASQLTEDVHFTFIGGGAGTMRRYEILRHVVNHASYHRGHIEGVFYQMSIEPPTTDISVFMCTRPPAS